MSAQVWIDRDGWTRKLDEDGHAWRWQDATKEWIRDHARDTK